MYCHFLSLTNFRNFAALNLELAPGMTVVLGDNAQGKSNLLEAIAYLATTRSLRASSDRELLTWGTDADPLAFTRVSASIKRRDASVRLEIVLRDDSRGTVGAANAPSLTKRIRLNDVPRRALDVIGTVNVVHFAPTDLELIVGPPANRRRYLDVTISQVDLPYCRGLARYNRVLTQRNHLLRAIREGHSQLAELAFWDGELSTAGARILSARLQAVGELASRAETWHQSLSGNGESLNVAYQSTAGPFDIGTDLPTIAERLSQRLAESRLRDIQAGATTIGPHRDDFSFALDGHDLGSFGSRGQQRTAALGLKLAEVDYLHATSGDSPILLLDDILSELDAKRRDRILGITAPNQQLIVTGTDASAFGDLPAPVETLQIGRGSIERVSSRSLAGGPPHTHQPLPEP